MVTCGRCRSEYPSIPPSGFRPWDYIESVTMEHGLDVPKGVSPNTRVCGECLDILVERLDEEVNNWWNDREGHGTEQSN